MKLSETACKIFLCQKLNEDGRWEYRISIFTSVNGKARERVFIKSLNQVDFIERLKWRLNTTDFDHLDKKIQRWTRFSLTQQKPVAGTSDMQKVPDYFFKEVNAIITEKQQELVNA